MPADLCPICSLPIGPLDHQFYGGKCFPCFWYKKEKESISPPVDPDAQFKWNEWAIAGKEGQP